MPTRLLRNCGVAFLLVSILLFSYSLPAFGASIKEQASNKIKTRATISRPTSNQTQTDLPYPSWWNGTCDTNNYSNAPNNTNHLLAYTLPKNNPIPASYRGVTSCGPRPYADNAPDVSVNFFSGAYPVLEWQCVELSMRFMYLAYGIAPYSADGKDVVGNYQSNNPTNSILQPINNSTTGMEPQEGDILSYAGTKNFPTGHTSIIKAAVYSSPGNGTITVLEENLSGSGTQKLTMTNGTINNGVSGWLHHTVDLLPQTTSPTSQVKVSATGFTANEQVAIRLDSTLLKTATADSSGAVSSTVIVPITASLGTRKVDLYGQTSHLDPQTVLYVQNPSSAQLSTSIKIGPPTTQVQITGFGFGASENITISFDTTQVGTVTSYSNGDFSSTATIPKSASLGTHTIQVTGQTSGTSLQASFLVRTDWPMFGFDTQHSGFNPYENILNTSNVAGLTQDWATQTSATIERQSDPVVANSIVYIGDDSGTLYAFDALTGSLLWSNPIAAQNTYGIESPPTVANGFVYIGADNLYILNATTGVLIKTISVPQAGLLSSPTIVNGVIYVGGSAGEVAALNASDGSLMWETSIGNIISGVPTVVNGIVYIDTIHAGLVVALDAKTGKVRWDGSLLEGANAAPVVANGMVFVHAYFAGPPASFTLYAFNASGCGSGNTMCSPIWKVPAPSSGNVLPSPAVANGVVYLGISDMNAFNAKTGKLLWTGTNPSGIGFDSSPAVANGVVYSVTSSGQMYAFNASGCGSVTCLPLWSYSLGAYGTQSSPAVVNGMVYIGAYSGISPYNGQVFAFHVPGTAS